MLPLLAQAGAHSLGSSIVNVSSIFGQVAGPIHSAYCASKGAVTLLTKSLANELPRLGMKIRSNSIHPGIMNAGVSVTGLNALVSLGAFNTAAEAETALSATIPYGRVGNAHEIPGAVAFLISDASTLMNGAEITLDGGYTAI
jgi:NAD(P)-dependent dehydrogenase (short-subunit alcohol dehydrogenase family)